MAEGVHGMAAQLRRWGIVSLSVVLLACARPAGQTQSPWHDPLTPGERAAITARGPIRYAPDPQFPPFESLNARRQAEGITPDILGLIARDLHLTITTVPGPDWSHCLQALKEGRADVLGTISKTKEREGYLAFTRPYFDMPYVLFVRAGGPSHPDFANLAGRRVGVVKDCYAQSWLLGRHPEVIAVPEQNTQAGMEDLAMGHLDAVLESLPVGLWVLRAEGITNLEVSSPVLFREPQYLAVAKGDAVLLGILQKGLDGLSPKELGGVFASWTGLDFTKSLWRMSRTLKTILVVFALLALFTLAWNFLLRRAMAQKTEELRQKEDRLRLLLERNLAGVYRNTLDGRFCECNEAFANLLGYPSRLAVMALNAADLYVDPSQRRTVVERLLRERQTTGEVLHLKRKDGKEVWAMVNQTLIEAPGQEPIVEGIFVDITERMRAEEALVESEARYRDLVENASDLICTHDLNGTLLSANATAALAAGYPVEDILGRNLRDALPPERRHEFDAYIETLRRDGVAAGIMQIVARNGEVRFWEYRNTLRTKGIGVPVVRGMARDVTKEVLAKQALKKSEEKYRTILENMEESYYEVDIAGNLTFFNDSLCRLLGYSRDELMGMNDRQFTDAENAKKLYRAFNAVYRTGEPTRGLDWEIVRKDGNKRINEASVSLRKDTSGKPIGFRGLIWDITERKRAERALARALSMQRELFEGSRDAIFISDADSRFVAVNRAACELTGYSVQELLSMRIPDLHEEADLHAYHAHHRDIMAGAEVLSEAPILRKDGRKVATEFNNRRLTVDGTFLMHSTARDITERNQVEEKLRQADVEREKARSAEAAAQLVQGLAHEVRNPLFAINVNIAVIEKKTSAVPDVAEHIAYVTEHVDRLNALMRDLLELGRQPLAGEMIECHLGDMALAAVHAAEAQAPDAGGRVFVEAPERSLTIGALPDRLQRALVHLILNALQNSSANGRVRVRAGQSGGQAFVEVVDEGPGIPGEIRDRVFDPFVTTHAGRRGLGLALAKNYVTAMGGTLEASNNDPPPGATFTVRLPLA